MSMNILFSANISNRHRTRLQTNHPEATFTFCDGMEEAQKHLPGADILATFGNDLTDERIEMARQLKWIMVLSAGLDEMPMETLAEKGIKVTNARGIHKTPMAEYAISMVLQVYRQEKALVHDEDNHKWDGTHHIEEISGRTMLVAGAGAIGQEVARLAKAFNMTTIGVSRSGRSVDHFDENHPVENLKQLLPRADFVVSVLPSTQATRHLFTASHFQAMPSHAVFLNMGRGDVVSETVLLDAIRTDEIAHVVLDVTENEPLPHNHPFWEEKNITITPHLSGVSSKYDTRALAIFEENLYLYKENKTELVNQVDLLRGY